MAGARLHLTFRGDLVSEPVIHRLGTDFELVTNIRRANIDEHHGWIILEVEGSEEQLSRAIAWLVEQGVLVDRIEA
jgi:ABC-type methionine transport system ATPase subunit